MIDLAGSRWLMILYLILFGRTTMAYGSIRFICSLDVCCVKGGGRMKCYVHVTPVRCTVVQVVSFVCYSAGSRVRSHVHCGWVSTYLTIL